jgi:hypothetical protein
MRPALTADTIEAEAAILRSRVLAVGADIRTRADPTYIMAAARSTARRQLRNAPDFIKNNAASIGLVASGGAIGVVATRFFSRSRIGRVHRVAGDPSRAAASAPREGAPSFSSQAKAIALSALAIGVGYVGGLLVPNTSTDRPIFGQPNAVLRGRLDELVKFNMRGMKLAALNMVGSSGLPSSMLVVFAMLSRFLFDPSPREAERGRS